MVGYEVYLGAGIALRFIITLRRLAREHVQHNAKPSRLENSLALLNKVNGDIRQKMPLQGS